jgi:hypothetical protein
MSKKITFTYDGKNYTLEYSREAIKQMEAQGFKIDEIDSKPQTMITMLFAGAFLMHHKNVFANRTLLDEIFSKFTHRGSLVETLATMYQESLLSLLDEPEDDEGNITWGAE